MLPTDHGWLPQPRSSCGHSFLRPEHTYTLPLALRIIIISIPVEKRSMNYAPPQRRPSCSPAHALLVTASFMRGARSWHGPCARGSSTLCRLPAGLLSACNENLCCFRRWHQRVTYAVRGGTAAACDSLHCFDDRALLLAGTSCGAASVAPCATPCCAHEPAVAPL